MHKIHTTDSVHYAKILQCQSTNDTGHDYRADASSHVRNSSSRRNDGRSRRRRLEGRCRAWHNAVRKNDRAARSGHQAGRDSHATRRCHGGDAVVGGACGGGPRAVRQVRAGSRGGDDGDSGRSVGNDRARVCAVGDAALRAVLVLAGAFDDELDAVVGGVGLEGRWDGPVV